MTSDGTILYDKSKDLKSYPASLTKLMTAIIVIENMPLDKVVTVGPEIYWDDVEGSMKSYLAMGEQISVENLMYYLLLFSANDVANILSVAVMDELGLDKSNMYSSFCDLMNKKASELGLVNSHFSNPHGLTKTDHYTTVYDLAMIVKYGLGLPEFRKIIGTREYTIPPTNLNKDPTIITNKNQMLLPDNANYYEYATGGKTGYTLAAMNNIFTLAKKGDVELICVCMKAESSEKRYLSATTLLDYGFELQDLVITPTLTPSPTLVPTLTAMPTPVIDPTVSPATGSTYEIYVCHEKVDPDPTNLKPDENGLFIAVMVISFLKYLIFRK
jgi:D-alanyl-D-alanine carboxypeptidase